MTRLIDELKKLPGIVSKSAQRLAFHILRASDDDAEALAGAVRDVKASDLEMLQDLITAAMNDAGRKVDDTMKSTMGGMLGGMGIPGM